jgi:hypothetical protein
MPPKVVKGAKSNDLRMFFGPGGSQPKQVPAVQVSEVQDAPKTPKPNKFEWVLFFSPN